MLFELNIIFKIQDMLDINLSPLLVVIVDLFCRHCCKIVQIH